MSRTNTTSEASASRLPGNDRVTLVSRFSSSSVAVFWFFSRATYWPASPDTPSATAGAIGANVPSVRATAAVAAITRASAPFVLLESLISHLFLSCDLAALNRDGPPTSRFSKIHQLPVWFRKI